MAGKDEALEPGGTAVDAAQSNWLFRRMPGTVTESLTPAQREALTLALGDQAWSRPPVNIRFTVPFINRRFYVTIVGGHDQRNAERRTKDRGRYPLRTVANVFFFIGLGTIFYAVALVALALQSAIVEF